MTYSRFQWLCRVLACKSVWCTVLVSSVCGVLAYDKSWRACFAMAVVLIVLLLALNEDLHEFETDSRSDA